MPFCARIVASQKRLCNGEQLKTDCNDNLSKPYDLAGDSASRQDREQKILLDLMSCIVALSTHAQNIHTELHKDVLKVVNRVNNLNGRVENLKQSSKQLPLSTAQINAGRSTLSRYTSVNPHARFCSSLQPLDRDILTASTRPQHVANVYHEIGRQLAHPVAHSATQTEPHILRQVVVNVDEEGASSVVPSQVVPVDVSGAQLRLQAARRKSQIIPISVQIPVSRRDTRRNTVAINDNDVKLAAKTCPTKSKSSRVLASSSVSTQLIVLSTKPEQIQEEDMYADMRAMTECPYELLPFQRMKQRRSKSWFSSLRKTKKKPIAEHASIKHLDLVQNKCVTVVEHDDDDGLVGIGRSMRRCMSLRLGSSSRRLVNKFRLSGTNPSVIYDDLPYNGNPTVSPSHKHSPRRDTPKKKLNLPISTQSQVLHLATLMRDCNGTVNGDTVLKKEDEQRHSASSGYGSGKDQCTEKQRPSSIISVGSINSLERTLQDSAGTYRIGYQLDFPEECTTDASHVGVENKSTSPQSSNEHASMSSCDPEGYYTSMRRHSGIISAGETSPLTSTPTSGSGDKGDEVIAVKEELTRIQCYPPLLDVTLSDCSETEDHAFLPTVTQPEPVHKPKQIHRPKVIPTRNVPIVTAKFASSPKKEIEDKLDQLLLKKFEAEIVNKRYGSGNLNSSCNDTVTDIDLMNSNGHRNANYVASSLPRQNAWAQFHSHLPCTASLPRKSVRFCN